MKKTITLILSAVFLIVSCKEKDNKQKEKFTEHNEVKKNSFDNKLLDYREIEKPLTEDIYIKSFGVLKEKDSISYLIFKVPNTVNTKTVNYYSAGIIGYNRTSFKKDLRKSGNMKLIKKDNQNYIVLNRPIREVNYLDSISIYFYKKQDYKSSGKLGEILIKDILFEK